MNLLGQIPGTSVMEAEEAEIKLDLRGLERQDALNTLDQMVRQCKKTSAKTLYVKFEAAKPGEGETLFQPVARYFRIEKKNGYIDHAMPVMTKETGGLFVTFRL